jgi:hypothetical protein
VEFFLNPDVRDGTPQCNPAIFRWNLILLPFVEVTPLSLTRLRESE